MAIPCRRNNFTEWAHAQAKSRADSSLRALSRTAAEERAIESMTLDHAASTVAALRAMPSS